MNGEDFKRLEQIIVNFKDDMKSEFRHQLGKIGTDTHFSSGKIGICPYFPKEVK